MEMWRFGSANRRGIMADIFLKSFKITADICSTILTVIIPRFFVPSVFFKGENHIICRSVKREFEFWYIKKFLCHETRNFFVSRDRPSSAVEYLNES